jgi:hypothetical protein
MCIKGFCEQGDEPQFSMNACNIFASVVTIHLSQKRLCSKSVSVFINLFFIHERLHARSCSKILKLLFLKM